MSDDFAEKLQKVKDMLNNNEIPDSVKNLFEQFSGSQSSGNSQEKFNLSSNEDMLLKVKKILDKKNDLNDPRITLLNAIKPYVNTNRQQKIDSYTKLLNVTLLSKILKDEDI